MSCLRSEGLVLELGLDPALPRQCGVWFLRNVSKYIWKVGLYLKKTAINSTAVAETASICSVLRTRSFLMA